MVLVPWSPHLIQKDPFWEKFLMRKGLSDLVSHGFLIEAQDISKLIEGSVLGTVLSEWFWSLGLLILFRRIRFGKSF